MSNSLPLPSSRWLRPSRWLVLEAGLLVLLLVQAARAMPLLVLATPSLPSPSPAPAATIPPPSLARWGDPFHRDEATPGVASASGYQLFGIRLAGAASSAILGREGVQRPYRIGDAIAPGWSLAAVAADHVVLRGPGGDARLALPNRPAGAAAGTAR